MDQPSNIETICIPQAVLVEGNSDHPIERFQTDKVRRREWFLCIRGENQARCVVEQQGSFWGIVTLVEPGGGAVRDVLGVEHPRYTKPPAFWSAGGISEYWRKFLPRHVDNLLSVNFELGALQSAHQNLCNQYARLRSEYQNSEHLFGQVRGEERRLLKDKKRTVDAYRRELHRLKQKRRLSPPQMQIRGQFREIIKAQTGVSPSDCLLSSLLHFFEKS